MRTHIFFILLLTGIFSLTAQWKEYPDEVKAGLKTGGNGIQVLCEDSKGNMWFGTDSFTGKLDRYSPE